ncbi:MAG TPA: FAD/NAD(P)-binding protein [Candidatus Sulfotelmatobacter sp.]|nr:FAD/NAD(P)-binding protein [Candidatus Sulfotelmatobacter sp.]
MTRKKEDRQLGMQCPITRRDFLNGVALGAGVVASSGWLEGFAGDEFAPEKTAGYYPPALTGMRGNHEGTYTYAHKLRDGESFGSMGAPEKTGEIYDLVVVGGGISGLAAAYFYRKAAGNKARILILDNHDDFGGHAKRNEFKAGNRILLSNGGTQSIENPARYSNVSKGLLQELGIETQRFYKAYDRNLYSSLKLGTGVFFNRETFGEDRLVAGMGRLPWPEFLAKTPLSETARRDIAKVYTENVDYLAGMTREQKRAKLAKTSYADFLTKIAKLSTDVLPFFQSFTHDLWCVGIEAVAALDCYEAGDDYGDLMYPGFQGMDLGAEEKAEPYIFHFPDGNASIARMLVRQLVTDSLPGSNMDDVVLARANYAQLDQTGSPVRIRLNSTVVRVQHTGSASAREVQIAYMRGGKLKKVQAKSCVLACYNMMIPYICPELSEKQKESLSYLVKAPLVYTHVAIRNWTSFQKLGVRQIMAPASYHNYVALDFPVSMGGYKFPSHPDEPMVLFMLRTPCQPGLSQRDQYRAGRYELMQTPFETFERNIRDQLARMLAAGGFDPARDIEAITVNRWAHGYAYTYDSLSDPDWPEGEQPWTLGRKRFGQIAIANSDAGASAYTDCAIDQGHRAVSELLFAKN